MKTSKPKITTFELKTIDWESRNRLTKPMLYEYAKYASKMVKQRLTRMEKFMEKNSNMNKDDALGRFNKDWYKVNFSVSKDSTINELRHTLKLAQTFLKLKGSTITGRKEIIKSFKARIEKDTNIKVRDLTQNEFDELWKVYNRTKYDLELAGIKDSNQKQKLIYDLIINKNFNENDLAIYIKENSDKLYEKVRLKELSTTKNSDGFDLK